MWHYKAKFQHLRIRYERKVKVPPPLVNYRNTFNISSQHSRDTHGFILGLHLQVGKVMVYQRFRSFSMYLLVKGDRKN